MNTKKLKIRLVFLYIGSFIISVAPLLIVMCFKWGDYTKTPTQTVKLCVGGIILLILVFLKVIGKLGVPRRIVSFSVVFILAYLLQAVLNDLMLLSGMALLGEFLDFICFQHAIRVTKENILVSKTANTTTEQVEKVLQKYLGNGRV
jgi:hypothetical protein